MPASSPPERPPRPPRPTRLLPALTLVLAVCVTRTGAIAPTSARPPSLHVQSILPYERLSAGDVAVRRRRDSAVFGRNMSALVTFLVRNYTTHHRRVRAACERDASLARRTRILVYRGNPNYGLGDRVRGALHAYLLAVATRRLLLLDQTEPFAFHAAWASASGTNYTYDGALFPAPRGHFARPATRDAVFDATFRKASDYAVAQRALIVVRMPGFAPRDVLAASHNFPPFASMLRERRILGFAPRRDELAPFLLQALYRPTLRLRALLRDARPFARDTRGGGARYLAVHARLGAGVGEVSGPRFNYSAQGLSLAAVARCVGRIGGRAATARGAKRVLVITDTRAVASHIGAGLRETMADGTVAFARGRVVHVGRMRALPRDRETFDAFMRAFVDVGLVGLASSVVHVRSGFADVGVWVGATADRQIVSIGACRRELSKKSPW